MTILWLIDTYNVELSFHNFYNFEILSTSKKMSKKIHKKKIKQSKKNSIFSLECQYSTPNSENSLQVIVIAPQTRDDMTASCSFEWMWRKRERERE
jgi:hypothetical protein